MMNYNEIICLENLLYAWQEFIRGKRNKEDVQDFSLRLSDNILQLHDDLANFSYEHGGYAAFNITDPKPRRIHKALVRDRVLHHAIYRQLYPLFDRYFIFDSYSCRLNKGTHKALIRFKEFSDKASKNYAKTVWLLKCDIKKFFASIDHEILLDILRCKIKDINILRLLEIVIRSFNPEKNNKGLPLGNLTSQLFCNIYLNEFDKFIKYKLKEKYYIRYADDFIIFSTDKEYLEKLITIISKFLKQKLELTLHPDKIFIKTLASGVDFLGWTNFEKYKTIRLITVRRMKKRIIEQPTNGTLQSYLGLMKHGDTFKLNEEILNIYGLFCENK